MLLNTGFKMHYSTFTTD